MRFFRSGHRCAFHPIKTSGGRPRRESVTSPSTPVYDRWCFDQSAPLLEAMFCYLSLSFSNTQYYNTICVSDIPITVRVWREIGYIEQCTCIIYIYIPLKFESWSIWVLAAIIFLGNDWTFQKNISNTRFENQLTVVKLYILRNSQFSLIHKKKKKMC